MLEVAQPNWLVVIGAIYIVYAFSLLAMAGVIGRTEPAAPGDVRQRSMLGFSGAFGLIGATCQALGQFLLLGFGPWVAVMLLAIIPMLLAYVIKTEGWMERSRAPAPVAEPRLLPTPAQPRALITREAAE